MEHIPSNREIAEISALARKQLDCQIRAAELEQKLKECQADLRQVQEIDLPAAMAQAGVSEIKLPSGVKITIKDDVYASIPKDERGDLAFTWLRNHGFGDVIKNEVKVAFGRGEEEQAAALLAECRAHGWNNASFAATVHPSTLKALIREQLASGKDFPLELFGAQPVSKAVIK